LKTFLESTSWTHITSTGLDNTILIANTFVLKSVPQTPTEKCLQDRQWKLMYNSQQWTGQQSSLLQATVYLIFNSLHYNESWGTILVHRLESQKH